MDSREPQTTKDETASLENKLAALTLELQRKNRELEIEAALDKIRSRASGMRSSSELAETSAILFQQLENLQIKAIRTGVGIFDEPNNAMELWVTSYSENEEVLKVLDYFSLYVHPVFENIIPARQQKKPYALTILKGNEVKEYYQTMSTYLAAPIQYNEREYYYSFFFLQGTINVVTGDVLSDDECKIVIRFAQVFGLIYTRFLDLQKAEEQTREAQIEAALERVRARSMAMHQSDDLQEVIKVVADQFNYLEIKFDTVSFVKLLEDGGWDLWVSTNDQPYPAKVTVPAFPNRIFDELNKYRKEGKSFYTGLYSYEEKNSFFNYFFEQTIARNTPEDRKRYVLSTPGYAISVFATKNISLNIANYEAKPYTEEENGILKRFALVFEQVYTRFLDLQKAEAQAREAQIEAALEKVRSSSLAMHHSNEIKEVVKRVFEKMKELGFFQNNSVMIVLPKNEFKDAVHWTFNEDFETMEYYIPSFDHPVSTEAMKLWRNGQKFFEISLNREEKDKFLDLVLSKTDYSKVPEEFKKLLYTTEAYNQFFAFEHHCGLLVDTFTAVEYTKDQKDIVTRFAKVFEQAYIRFLDLQKAEAQAREAQIEAALERVRSKTMAMQKTGELLDAAELVHKELSALGINSMNVSYAFVDEDEKYGSYYSINPVDGRIVPIPFIFPHTETEVMRSILSSWRTQESLNVIELNENETLKHQTYIGEHIQKQLAKNNIPFSLEEFLTISPKKAVLSTFNFSKGYLFNIGGERLSKIQEELMLRFTKVFEQTYTRFLDLKKAEAQAREAQIETSLEKVRAQALGMHKANELLNVCKVLFKELLALGFTQLRNTIIQDFKDGKKYFTDYDYSDLTGGAITDISYDANPIIKNFIKQIRRSDNAFVEITIKGKDLNDWREFRIIGGQPDDPRLNKAEALHYYLHSIHNASIGISTFEAINEEELQLLKRFRNVFDFAYRRYLDIAQAEAQAREAQIELGLERVRARAMAMQKSDELSELVDTVFKELTKLDFALTWCIINIIDEGSMSNTVWAANPDINKAPESYHMLFEDYPFHHAMMKGWKERKTKDVYILEGQEKKVYDEYLFSETEFRRVPVAAQEASRAMEKYVVTFSFSNFGGLQTVGDVPLSDANLDILSRFGKVFDLTYTRFNDLKQAEAQAREALIEAALERVRSRSMGMQKSEELKEVIKLVYQQLIHLKINLDHAGFVVDYKPKGDWTFWIADEQDIPSKITHPYFESVWANQFNEAKEKGADFFVTNLNFEEKNKFYRELLSYVPGLPEASKNFYLSCPGLAATTVLFKDVGLYIENFSGTPYTDDENNTLMRFGKVFQQTYTRFLDLQKAEERAREARIEAALERVRARSMGMQRSDELQEVVGVLYKQFEELEFGLYQVLVSIFDLKQNRIEWWSRNIIDLELPQRNYIPMVDHPFPNRIMERWKAGEEYYEHILEGETKQTWDDYLFTKTDLRKFPEEIKTAMRSVDRVYLSDVFMKYGSLQAAGSAPLPADKVEILIRFTRVLDLAYTRMIELQNAEEQAKESKIQLALERVRARTMAMQKSEELAETASVLFEQLRDLGESPERTFIGIINKEEKVLETWASQHGGALMTMLLKLSLDEPFVVKKAYHAWKDQKKSLSIDLKGEELEGYFQYLKGLGAPVKREIFGERRLENLAFFSKGFLGVITTEPVSHDALHLYERFAKVFDLTYTRFLDLQRAEAQAKESQVQLALERVRARTMAMQRSDELPEATFVLFQQLKELGQTAAQISIGIIKADEGYVELSATLHGTQLLQTYRLPIDEQWVTRKLVDAWLEKKRTLNILLEGEELKNYNAWRNSILERKVEFKEDKWFVNVVYFSQGMLSFSSSEQISGETLELLERFAGVFDQTYRRFLDLQRAEAQARESQIEAALERVRSRAMAMQNSNELGALIGTVFAELVKLDLVLTRSVLWITDAKTKDTTWWMANSEDPDNPISCLLPYHEHPPYLAFLEQWKKRALRFEYELKGKVKRDWDVFLFNETGLKNLPDVVKEGMKAPERVLLSASFNNFGGINLASLEPLSEEHFEILLRFARVFDLTYTRFNDLKQAEAQRREAQIELALERVRARTMAMHRSEELAETAQVMFYQLQELGEIPDRISIGVVDEANENVKFWTTDQSGSHINFSFNARLTERTVISKTYQAWKENKKSLIIDLHGDELNEWIRFAREEMGIPVQDKFIKGRRVHNLAFFSHGWILVTTNEIQSDEAIQILERFASVFNLTYRRFLDLEKAEAQAREAEIEASLERVRSKTMAMHNSHEVGDTVASMFEELLKLGVDETIRCGIAIFINPGKIELWTAFVGEKGITLNIGYLDTGMHPLLQGNVNAWMNKEPGFTYILEGEDLLNYYKGLNSAPEYHVQIDIASLPSRMIHNNFYFSEGSLFAFARQPLSPEITQIFKRFAAIFGQTYRRYLDLQKAEAQARESQIEAGLERVRARTMAMHSSEDVSTATATMFIELEKLGIPHVRGGITIIKPDQTQEVWGINNLSEGVATRSIGVFDMRLHPLWQQIFHKRENNEEYGYYWLAGKDKQNYIDILNSTPNYLKQPIKDFPDVHVQTYLFGEGGIWTNSLEPHTEEQKQTMKKFASVFSLTFRRYLDLQKAEAQAKEAQIEAGLERVRAKAMAMHDSQDLTDTIGVFYKELKTFSITPRRCGVGLLDQEERIGELFTWNTTEQGESLELVGRLKMEGHPVLEAVYDNWLTQTEYHPVLRGNEIKEYYKVVRPQMSFPDYQHDEAQFGYFFFFKEGGVYAWTEKEMKEDELQIYRRFTSVLSLTYKRYKDLKQAEASTKEALRQASLDRVRAEIASMRTVEDLQRITPVIWNELTTLSIPFIRCGIFIMDDEQKLAHTFLSTPDGKAIASFHLPYDTPGNINIVMNNWRHKEQYVDHWDETEFRQFAEILVKQGAMASAETYLKAIPHGGFYLHFLPFLQGMLYVGNLERLNEEETELIQHVADAFSTAYARYEDFNRLEAAKQQVERTLTDLKQAQTQLVQSEKMASLGELTAGIAHEIQNPLNFVNNFSDVSAELLDEMMDELLKGNIDSAKEIVDDVKQNLEKINFHGRRADGIVKGMLQHSRTSSGQKEISDINALADEYLRLAYHGLRAKDKSFNAKFETDFDASVSKVHIIPQDIGRVILNLINNAFYAVNERKKLNAAGYEPTVTVTTRNMNDKVEIRVKDNGIGIPQKVLDKIFQPFFTTKPTGQGTGLGLSLSYDIINKGHGGNLSVETKENEGTVFIIQLPGKS